eukprot:6199039-Alexandrium_andersonii.AAC.1
MPADWASSRSGEELGSKLRSSPEGCAELNSSWESELGATSSSWESEHGATSSQLNDFNNRTGIPSRNR